MKISEIQVGQRHRKDLGDIKALAESMHRLGLLQPVVITPENQLVAGKRRLEAAKRNGWTEIPVHIVENLADALAALQAERDENVCRKDFTPSEAVEIGKSLETIARAAAKERQRKGAKEGGKNGKRGKKENKLPEIFRKLKKDESKETRNKVGAAVGMSGKTFQKAKTVVESAEQDPETFGDLPALMDKSSPDRAFRELKRRKEEQKVEQAAASLKQSPAEEVADLRQCSMQELLSSLKDIDAIITDPPYPEKFLPLYFELARLAADCLKPDGILAVMCGQSYLPKILASMTQYVPYRWTIAYLTPGGQAVQLWDRKVNTFWKPVLLFGGKPKWIGDVVKSSVNDNDKRFHHWGQSESGMADLVEALTEPGQTICDPFMGAGTTGVVSIALARRFVGCDVDESCVETAKKRMTCGIGQ